MSKKRLEEVNGLIKEAQAFTAEFLGINYPKQLSITQVKEHICYELYVSPKLELLYDYFEISQELSPDKGRISRLAKKSKKEGNDVFMKELEAYENGGIFLTEQTAKFANTGIVGTIMHELLHTQLDLDISVEESIASTIESLATVRFYEQKEGKQSRNYEKAVIDDNHAIVNDHIIIQYYYMLYDVYGQEILDKEKLKIKKELCKEAEQKLTFECKLNNASLTYYMTYSRYANDIREICKYTPLKDAVSFFKQLPKDRMQAYNSLKELISSYKNNKI